jgi:DNA mismatch endonuclease (patch repair protein)
MDHLSPAARSANMAKIKGKNTRPELIVRQTLHAMGYRFRLHRRDLPGRPDIVLPRYRTVVFVHGCYWHRHVGCARSTMPQTRRDFWQTKFAGTVERDRAQAERLVAAGWNVAVIWECETRNREALQSRLLDVFGGQ